MSAEAFCEGSGGIFAAWETDGQVYFARIDPTTGKAAGAFRGTGNGQGAPASLVSGQFPRRSFAGVVGRGAVGPGRHGGLASFRQEWQRHRGIGTGGRYTRLESGGGLRPARRRVHGSVLSGFNPAARRTINLPSTSGLIPFASGRTEPSAIKNWQTPTRALPKLRLYGSSAD